MEPQEKRSYTLKSRCPRCGEVKTEVYTHGIEKYTCSNGHYWEKTPQSTTAAIMGAIQGEEL